MIDLDDEFEDYMRLCNPTVEITTAQYRESRRVFFAGVTSAYAAIFVGLAGVSGEDEAVEELRKLETQLREFASKVGFNT